MSSATLAILVIGSLSAPPGEDEPVGTWRFQQDDRPIKVVVVGGSIAAWGQGNYGQFLQKVCSRIDVENISQTGYGTWALKKRFRAQVIKNWNVKLKDKRYEYWMVHSGGLNSIYTPEMTIKHAMDTFVMARKVGVKVLAISLTPWGDEGDKRWRAFGGVEYRQKTQKAVDFVMGRLKRTDALGRYAHGEGTGPEADKWREGELPDRAVDLYNSALRDRTADIRNVAKLEKLWDNTRQIRAQYPERKHAVKQASEVPRWYLKEGLRAFDHIHPNTEGHRLMAETVCPRLPSGWGCQCSQMKNLTWRKGHIVEADAK